MSANFYIDEDDLLDDDHFEKSTEGELYDDTLLIDSEEEENARYREIIRELTEFEELYSESTIDE